MWRVHVVNKGELAKGLLYIIIIFSVILIHLVRGARRGASCLARRARAPANNQL